VAVSTQTTPTGAQANSRGLRGPGPRTGTPGPVPVRSRLTGAEFDRRLPFDAWKELGAKLGSVSSGSSWWLGDWLVFGRAAYGRRYREAVAVTGLDYQTLRNYAMVARRFELSRRRDDVTFQHHAEVCSLDDDEQDLWLDLAAAHGWSKAELRRRTRSLAPARAGERRRWVRLTFEAAQVERWRVAASRDGVELGAWMSVTLDQAAEQVALPGDVRLLD
jgi:hypothetical protein